MVRKFGQTSRDKAVQLVVVKAEGVDLRFGGHVPVHSTTQFLENCYMPASENDDRKNKNKNRTWLERASRSS